MPFPTSVDAIVDAPPVTAATRIASSQVLGPQRITVGPAWFNVKSDQYGALGDGSTDDTAAINAAETAAAASGGRLYWPAGTYIASGIVKLSNSTWLGAGINASIIKLKNSAPTGTPLVIGQNFASLTGTTSTGGVTGFTIHDMTFDGNKANNPSHTVPLIQWYGFGYGMNNFVIISPNNVGLYSEWAPDTSGPVVGPAGLEAHIRHFEILFAGSTGMQWNGPHDSAIADGNIENAGRGIHLMARGGATQFQNVHCWGATQDWSWFLEDGCHMIMCQGEDGTVGAAWLRGVACQIIGGKFFGTPVGVRLGIAAGAASSNCFLDGVLIYNCTTTAIDLANDGGSNRITYYTTGGNAADVTGTAADKTVINGYGALAGSRSSGDNMRSSIAEASAATLTPNALIDVHDMVLTANLTVNAPTNGRTGARMMFVFVQDATGGRTITFAANYRNSTGAAIVTTANTKTVDEYFCRDGTNWLLLSRQTGQT